MHKESILISRLIAALTVFVTLASACGDEVQRPSGDPDSWEVFLADRLGWGAGTNLGDSTTPRSVQTPTIPLLVAYGSSPRSTDNTAPTQSPADWTRTAFANSRLPSTGVGAVEEFFAATTSSFYELDVQVIPVELSTGHCNDGDTMRAEAVQDLIETTEVNLASYDADADGTVTTAELRVVFVHDCITDFGNVERLTGSADGVDYRLSVPMAARANSTLTTFMHELFHQFSARDLYPTSRGPRCNGGCFGVTIMHNTESGTPPLLLDAPHRFSFGWITPRVAHAGDGSEIPPEFSNSNLPGGGGIGTGARIAPAEQSTYLAAGALVVYGDDFPNGYWILEVRNDRNSGATYDLRPASGGKRGIVVWRVQLEAGSGKLLTIDNNSPIMVAAAGLSSPWLGPENPPDTRAWTPRSDGTLRIPLVLPDPNRATGSYSGSFIEIREWDPAQLVGWATLRASTS